MVYAGGKQPNETLDKLKLTWCPADKRLTLTVTTDMIIRTGGQDLQAIRMWAKQWSFTAEHGADSFVGCIVRGFALPTCLSYKRLTATVGSGVMKCCGLCTLGKLQTVCISCRAMATKEP